MSNGFVCLMGMGTVFVGLICIIVLCVIMSEVCKMFANPETRQQKPAAPAAAPSTAIENKQEILAGVCAAIAEDLGTDVNNIKVTSFKKL